MKQTRFNYGWVIVGVSFAMLALSGGIWYSFSVFFVAVLNEFGWSRSLGAGAFSLFLIVQSFGVFVVGNMIDRFGPNKVVLLGSLLLGTGLALCSTIDSWWEFYLYFGVISALGVAATGWVPNTTMVQQWFKEKRGLAIGIVCAGVGVGIFVCVPAAQYLINRVGWRMTYRTFAIILPVAIAAMAVFLIRRPPQPLLSEPSGRNQPVLCLVPSESPPLDDVRTYHSWTLKQAVRTRPFQLLALSVFSGTFATQAIMTHQVAFFTDQGLGNLLASYAVGVIGLVSIGAKIFWGILSDKIGREITYTLGIVCGVCGMALLILFHILPSSWVPYSYAFLFGMGYSVTTTLPPVIAADFFEGKTFGAIFGTLMMFNGIGGALGAWFAGFVYDHTRTYLFVFILTMACYSFACVNVWRAAPRKARTVLQK
jgi:MFS family permease